MLEMKITIEAPELANALNNLAAAMGAKQAPQPVAAVQQPVVAAPQPAPATTAQQSVPVAGVPLAQPPKYTVDQIMAAGAQLMDAGKVNDLMNLLHSFGVQAVMDLKQEQLGAFATALREMGAKI